MVDDKYRALLEAERGKVMSYVERALAALRASQA
jgi:hypothetical protein